MKNNEPRIVEGLDFGDPISILVEEVCIRIDPMGVLKAFVDNHCLSSDKYVEYINKRSIPKAYNESKDRIVELGLSYQVFKKYLWQRIMWILRQCSDTSISFTDAGKWLSKKL